MDIYRLMWNYKGTVYQSTKFYKSKEKAEKVALKNTDARAILWLKREKGVESLVYCFELAR